MRVYQCKKKDVGLVLKLLNMTSEKKEKKGRDEIQMILHLNSVIVKHAGIRHDSKHEIIF